MRHHEHPSRHILSQDSSTKKQWIAGALVLFAIVIAVFFSGKATTLIKGMFEACPDGEEFCLVERNLIPADELIRRDRITDMPFSAEQEFADWQRKISDDPMPVIPFDNSEETSKENGQTPPPPIQNKIVISITPKFPLNITADAATITPQKPLDVASYRMCTKGAEDAIIKSLSIRSFGTYTPKTIQIYVDQKAVSNPITIMQDWTGDFLTVDNHIVKKDTCSDVVVKMLSADAGTIWQRFEFNGLSVNMEKEIIYQDDAGLFIGDPHSLIVFKPEKHVLVQYPMMQNQEFLYSPQTPSQDYGTFLLSTKPNSTATVKSITVRMITDSDKSISVSPRTKQEAYSCFGDNCTFPEGWFSALQPGNGLPAYVLAPNKDVVIPLDLSIPYSTNLSLNFSGNPPTKNLMMFTLAIVALDTDAKIEWKKPSPLPGPGIIISDEKSDSVPEIIIHPSPISGGNNKWFDASEAQTTLKKNPLTFAYLSLDQTVQAPMQVKNLKIKMGGTFSNTLKFRVAYLNALQQTMTQDYEVSKNGILSLPDHDLKASDSIEFQLLEYPPNPQFIFSLKPTITSLEMYQGSAGAVYKKGDPVALSINKVDIQSGQNKIEKLTKWPQSFGIISFGPTTLVKTSDQKNPGVTYVDIAKLPKDKSSAFNVNSACFIAQGNSQMLEITYQHVVRDTSPFTDIKLKADWVDVYLKPKDWTKEEAVFTLTNPAYVGNDNYICLKLDVIDPKETAEDFWFSLVGVKAVTPEKVTNVPVYNESKLLQDLPIKGTVYTFK